MISEKEIQSMLYLLDDNDERVVEHIEEKLFALGEEIVPFLEKTWPLETNVKRQERIIEIIKNISQQSLVQELKVWIKSENKDLLDGIIIIEKILDPNIDKQVIDNKLDKIKLDAWLELNYDLTSFEKVKILNHIIFDVHKFRGDTDNYHHSNNSFLSSVLERKKGNPISLAIIYSIIAQRLNIPVYGVNLPQHFVLGYIKDLEWQPLKKFNDDSILRDEEGSDVMFYINPFNSGLIFNRDNIHKFLKQLNLEPKDEYFRACSNPSIVRRILRNLEASFAKENNAPKLSQVRHLINVLNSEV
jgi:regulator of sirC expression with transglutaminase-like and TPR domain